MAPAMFVRRWWTATELGSFVFVGEPTTVEGSWADGAEGYAIERIATEAEVAAVMAEIEAWQGTYGDAEYMRHLLVEVYSLPGAPRPGGKPVEFLGCYWMWDPIIPPQSAEDVAEYNRLCHEQDMTDHEFAEAMRDRAKS